MRSPQEMTTTWSLIDADRVLYSGMMWNELENAIRRIPDAAYWPNEICDLVSPTGQVLSVGIAKKQSNENPLLACDLACANHQAANGNPPYLSVVGNDELDLESGGVVAFRYDNGHWTEILRRNCVPVETMLRIAKHFMENDELPNWVAWEEA